MRLASLLVCLCFAEWIAPGRGCIGACTGRKDFAFVALPPVSAATYSGGNPKISVCQSHGFRAMLAKGKRRAFMALENGENDDDEEHGGGGQQRREDAQEEEKRAVARAIERRNRSRETPLSQKWFKLKQKSITPAQKRILNELWPAYGLEVRYGDTLDLDKVFGRAADGGGSWARKGERRRRVLDIGFGTGDSIAGMAALDIDGDFLGVELHRASIAAALEKFRSQELGNVRVVKHDVSVLLKEHMRGEAFTEAYILFPDPWPGQRDAGRRVLREGTASLLASRMCDGAYLRVATDVEEYAEHVRCVMGGVPETWAPCSEVVYRAGEEGGVWQRPRTRYERRAAEMGHNVYEFEYRLSKNS